MSIPCCGKNDIENTRFVPFNRPKTRMILNIYIYMNKIENKFNFLNFYYMHP